MYTSLISSPRSSFAEWTFDAAGAWYKRLNSLKAWLHTTTREEYLRSSLSGRDMARPFFCLMVVGNFVANALLGLTDPPWRLFSADTRTWSYVDYLYLFALVAFWKTPTHSLRFDFIVSFLFSLYYILIGTMNRVSSPTQSACFVSDLVGFHAVTIIAGLHPIAQGVTLFSLGMFMFCTEQTEGAIYFVLVGLLVSWMNGIQQHRAAITLLDLEQQIVATGQLLDHATDGFCKVSRPAGQIIDASSKLESTFGVEDGLQSHTLDDFLPSHRDQEVLRTAITELNTVSPILVTCRTQIAEEFEARLIPLVASEDDVSICVQILGEKRLVGGAGEKRLVGGAHCTLDKSVGVTVSSDEGSHGDGSELMDLVSISGGQSSSRPPTMSTLCYSKSSGTPSHLSGNPVHANLARQVDAQEIDEQVPSAHVTKSVLNSTVSVSTQTEQQLKQDLHQQVISMAPSRVQQPLVAPGAAVDANHDGQAEAHKVDDQVSVLDGSEFAIENMVGAGIQAQGHHTQRHRQRDTSRRPPRPPGANENLAHKAKFGDRGKRKHGQAVHRIALNVGNRRVSRFAETGETTIEIMIESVICGCNIRAIGCCDWHIGLEVLRQFGKRAAQKPCKTDFEPNIGWQCWSCLAINDEDGDAYGDDDPGSDFLTTCYICGELQLIEGDVQVEPKRNDSVAVSSSDYIADAEKDAAEDSEVPSV